MEPIKTRLPDLDAAVPMLTGQVHLRTDVGAWGGSAVLARATAVDLHLMMPVLLVTAPTKDLGAVSGHLTRLGLPEGSPDFALVEGLDLADVVRALLDLEAASGRTPALVVEDLMTMVTMSSQPSPYAPRLGAGAIAIDSFLRSLVPFRERGSAVVLHASVRSQSNLPRPLRFAAHTITELKQHPDSSVIGLTGVKCRNGAPFARVAMVVDRDDVREPVASPSMGLACLRSFPQGLRLLEDSLRGLDPETLETLEAAWEGDLEELVAALDELGPEAFSSCA